MLRYAHVRTTERIAAFIPGASPPEVRTPMFLIDLLILFQKVLKTNKLNLYNTLDLRISEKRAQK